MIVEGRAEVGGNYLCGVATDEEDTQAGIMALAENLALAMEEGLRRMEKVARPLWTGNA